MTATAFAFHYTTPKVPDPSRLKAIGREWGALFLQRLQRERLSGGGGSGMGLNRRSGNLSRDWNTVASADAGNLTVHIETTGTGDKYARLQEFGGTVVPKSSEWLWIPLDQNKTSNGVARITPRQAVSNGGFYTNARNGGKIFWAYALTKAARKKAKGELVPLFVLKKSVYVPARMGATSLFESMLPLLGYAVIAEVEGVLDV